MPNASFSELTPENLQETELMELNFNNLPSHLFNNILFQLPILDFPQIALVNSQFKEQVCSAMRELFFKLDSKVDKELENLRNEIWRIPSEEEIIILRLPHFRSHFILEIIKSEMNVLKTANRRDLYGNSESIINMAHILHLYQDTYQKAKRKSLPPYHISDSFLSRLSKSTKTYLDQIYRIEADDEFFGARIFETLDLFVKKMYKIKIRYTPFFNRCLIDATYEILLPQFVQPPPKLMDGDNLVPTSEDKKNIIDFLINTVRNNNRLILKDEQYYRELESTRGIQTHEFLYGTTHTIVTRTRLISRQLRTYKLLPNPSRKIEYKNGFYEIEEEFKNNLNLSDPLRSQSGMFKCEITMSCPMDVIPRHVAASWKRLKTELYGGALNSNPLWSNLAQHLRNDYNQPKSDVNKTIALNCTMNMISSLFQRDIGDVTLRFREP